MVQVGCQKHRRIYILILSYLGCSQTWLDFLWIIIIGYVTKFTKKMLEQKNLLKPSVNSRGLWVVGKKK